jgi:metallo-beta-lactamase class B
MKKLAPVLDGLFGVLVLAGTAAAQIATPSTWSQAQKPFKLYGNSYYVGTRGLGSILIVSGTGHVLIDGAVPAAGAMIAANIKELGFKIEDVKLILNTHVHFDHAGGIAELQRLSGAKVAASEASAKVLTSGLAGNDDPQFGRLPPIARIPDVQVFKDSEILKAGSTAVTAHYTPGHTPGGTSWTWQSCEGQRCLNMVYADSLNPVSAPGYKYSDSARKPNAAQWLEQSFAVVANLPCDILIVPHPELVQLFERLAKREQGTADALVDAAACRNYVAASRNKLQARLMEEVGK